MTYTITGYEILDQNIRVDLNYRRKTVSVYLTDEEINASADGQALVEFVRNKLDRKLIGDALKPKLNSIINQTVTV